MTKNVVEVHPGACGFVARIEASSGDQRHVHVPFGDLKADSVTCPG